MSRNIVVTCILAWSFLYLVESNHSAPKLKKSPIGNEGDVHTMKNTDFDDSSKYPPYLNTNTSDDAGQKHLNKTCPMCMARDIVKHFRLEMIKEKILKSLGMEHPPNITKPLPTIPILADLLPTFQRDDPAPVHRRGTSITERVITFASKLPSKTVKSDVDESACCYFDFPRGVMDNTVHRARLWVYIQPKKVVQDTATWLNIHQLWSQDKKYMKGKIVRSKKIHLTTGKWESIDFKYIVHEWFTDPESNWGIIIEAKDHNGDSVVVTSTSDDEEKKPFLEINVMPHNIRNKRRARGLECEEHSNEEKCCRYKFKVDFEAFGWDWVIAPKVYDANYCAGTCPTNFLTQYPHTYVVEHINSNGNVGPCCTPTKMSSISMLYFNDKTNIIYGEIPEMVVNVCGCS